MMPTAEQIRKRSWRMEFITSVNRLLDRGKKLGFIVEDNIIDEVSLLAGMIAARTGRIIDPIERREMMKQIAEHIEIAAAAHAAKENHD